MAVIKQLDKRSGITYIYESKYVWDKERKQSRSVRRLIGRLDAKTDEIIETDGRRRGGKALGGDPCPGQGRGPSAEKVRAGRHRVCVRAQVLRGDLPA